MMQLNSRSGLTTVLVAMVAMCLLAGAQASMRGNSFKGGTQPVELSADAVKVPDWHRDAAEREKQARLEAQEEQAQLKPHGEEEAHESDEHKEAHSEKKGKEGEHEEEHAGSLFAISFFAAIGLFAVVFAMTQTSNKTVVNYTWFLIDQVIAIFLAVMYFQAFDSLIDHAIHSLGMGVHSAILLSVLHAIASLAMLLILAYLLRKHEVCCAIVCGCGAHIGSFSSVHAAAGLQNHWFEIAGFWHTCILGMIVLGLGLAFIGYLIYTAKKSASLVEDDAFMDKTDDMENDFGAMAFSVVFTMFARFLLSGHHPEDDETEFDHTAADRHKMLAYAFGCLVVAAFVVTFVSKKAAATDSYAAKRVYNFIKTVATMNVAWAFLYWGEWQFFEKLFPGEEIKARVMFAITATVVGGLGLAALTLRTPPEGNLAAAYKSEQLVALTAISLIIAWSWELTFDAAVESLTEGQPHPHHYKIGLTLALFAIVVPVYGVYVKPISGPAAEAIGA